MTKAEIIELAVRTVESSPDWVLQRSGMDELLAEYRERWARSGGKEHG